MEICVTIRHERAEKNSVIRNIGNSRGKSATSATLYYIHSRGRALAGLDAQEKGVVSSSWEFSIPSSAEHTNTIIYYLVIVYRRYAHTLQLFSIVWEDGGMCGVGFLCLCY